MKKVSWKRSENLLCAALYRRRQLAWFQTIVCSDRLYIKAMCARLDIKTSKVCLIMGQSYLFQNLQGSSQPRQTRRTLLPTWTSNQAMLSLISAESPRLARREAALAGWLQNNQKGPAEGVSTPWCTGLRLCTQPKSEGQKILLLLLILPVSARLLMLSIPELV